jgi:hypothetical protein
MLVKRVLDLCENGMVGLEQEKDEMSGPRKHLQTPSMMGSETIINNDPPTYGGLYQQRRAPIRKDLGQYTNTKICAN